MKSKSKTGKPRLAVSSLRTIPGWGLIRRIEMPADAEEGRSSKYSPSTEPHAILKAVVLTLWLQAGRKERCRLCRGQCSGQTFKRTMMAWTKSTDKKPILLPRIWRGYLSKLAESQRAEWRKRLRYQALAWKNWDTAAKYAQIVFSPWFSAIKKETLRYR